MASPLGFLDNLQRQVERFPQALAGGAASATALTNAILRGPLPLPEAPAGGPLAQRAAEAAAHASALLAAHAALQGSLGEVLAWHAGLLDACASLQRALDGRAAAQGAPPRRLHAAERCRELLCELQGDYATECAVRAAVASSLLPEGCAARAAQGAAGAREGGQEGGAAAEPYALPRAEESDREALTLAVAAWAVPAHASAARSARVLASVRDVLQAEF